MPKGLPKQVKQCLSKALDSALLAVEMYNKPAVKFKSGGFIVLMSIAWTSLFHAVFINNDIKPIYREKNNRRFKKIDGEYQFWELKTCVKKYFENDVNNPIRLNIEFFIPLRNKLEHKFMPELDANIFAECQALLLNFDKIVEKEFGVKYCLRETLSFALQMFPSSRILAMAIKDNKDKKKVVEWIERYRSSISTDVYNSGEFAFKAFLIQVGNHNTKEALPIQFYAYDKLSDEDKRNVDRIAALVKTKIEHHNVAVSNMNTFNPCEVVKAVQYGIGDIKESKNGKSVNRFNMNTHTLCWKKYAVRPDSDSSNPELTKSEYCIYDSRNKNYGYTQAWIDFLIEKMSDEEEYHSLYII